MTRIFVYGTLKTGGSNHQFMKDQVFVGTAMTKPLYRLYDMGGFPGMVRDEAHGLAVQGEVWDVSAKCLEALDVLEGLDEGEYAREEIPLLPPYEAESVQGYRYLRSVTGQRDLGAVW